MTTEQIIPEQRKERAQIFLTADEMRALAEYTRMHSGRFETVSQAGAHLIRRALMAQIDEGTEGLLLPSVQHTVQEAVKTQLEGIREEWLRSIRQEVRETARRETEDAVAKYTKQLGNRVAALLVNAGKDAHIAVQLCLTLLEYDLEDKERVKAYHEEAQIAAGKRYNRQGLDRANNGETS